MGSSIMATNAEANAAGFITPADSDLIQNGDDAISQNARATLDLFGKTFQIADSPLGASDDIFALPAKVYGVNSGGSANPQLPIGRAGELWIPTNPGLPRSLLFTTNDLGDVVNGARMFIIGSDNAGSFEGRTWRELTTIARGLPSNQAIDVWAGRDGYNGAFAIQNSAVDGHGSHNPSKYGYNLYHETQKNGGSYQTAHTTHVGDQGAYFRAERATATGEMTLWKRLMDERLSPALNRHELLWEAMAADNGGTVHTGGAVPVALTFDDYPRDFRDRMKPVIETLGLSCTIGLSSKMYDPTSTVIYAGAEGTTFAEIDAWPSWITVAAHGATHGNAEDRLSLEAEIVDGKKDLQAALPNKKIYTFMQPSVIYDAGFDNGNSLESYAGTIAGHMQLGHHAYVTGVRRPADMATSCVMTGNRPIQGLVRNWLDTKSGIDTAKTRITAARAKRHGLIVAAHADRFGKSGFATLAEMTDFLYWLKAEQDAGRVKVLTLEQFALAQYGTPPPVVSNAVGRTVTVWDTLNNRDQIIYGDTGLRDLTSMVDPTFNKLPGMVLVRRNGNIVTLSINSIGREAAGAGNVILFTLPQGLRPEANRYDWTFRDLRCAALSGGNVYITNPGASVDYLSFTFATQDPWPTALPGVAA